MVHPLRSGRRCFTVLALVTALTTAAHADSSWPSFTQTPLTTLSKGGCELGTRGPIGVVGPVLEVGGSTCLIVDPGDGCAACGVGFAPASFIATLWVDADCSAVVRTSLHSADLTQTDCPAPGALECAGPDDTVTLVSGFNQIEVGLECPCVDSGYLYALCIELISTDCNEVRRTSDSSGEGQFCTSYYSSPAGILIDEASLGIPGRLGIMATGTCCENPVDSHSPSWGSVKKAYED